MKNQTFRRGFTLIELLVVIAIISLLSSLVLASLSESRVKARNASRNQMIIQYRNALELYRSDHDAYPNIESACLTAASAAESCGFNNSVLGNDTLASNLSPYISAASSVAQSPIEIDSSTSFSGALYTCWSSCKFPTIQWVLEGVDQECLPGSISSPANLATQCALTLN